MQLLINIILSSVVQFLLFAILPFLWWLATGRKEKSFFRWVGYKKIRINHKMRFWLLIIAIQAIFLIVFLAIVPMVSSGQMATSQFTGLGISAILPVMIYAFFQTAFNEELLFRGFLGKRLINKLGFAMGNVIQAAVFGLMHGLMFFPSVGLVKAAIVTVFTGIIGFGMGYLNEKEAGGSIVPSWLIHGVANTCSSVAALFSLI